MRCPNNGSVCVLIYLPVSVVVHMLFKVMLLYKCELYLNEYIMLYVCIVLLSSLICMGVTKMVLINKESHNILLKSLLCHL